MYSGGGICLIAATSSIQNLFSIRDCLKIVRSPLVKVSVRCISKSNCWLQATSRLTPQEVNNILRANEQTKEFPQGENCVRSCDTNQLASNYPIEDTRNEAYLRYSKGFLFGVFDGHSGGGSAQVVAKRLFHYIASYLLPREELAKLNKANSAGETVKLLDMFSERFEFVDVLRDLYTESFKRYVANLKASDDPKPSAALSTAFTALDADISREALETETNTRLNLKTLSVAMSGAVSTVAYVQGSDLHVASTGDCQAVLGVLSDGNWAPKVLSVQHNADNYAEVERILLEHPANERDSIIKFDRLFGQLAPLRAFGDYRYKWSKDVLKRMVVPHYGESTIPPGYLTPPYLTAQPDITYHHLTPKDKFLILATDGLWDFISPLQAVRLVGEHMSGKTVLTPFSLPRPDMTLGDIQEALLVRRQCLTMKPIDRNASSHLIRNALCSTEYGLDQSRLAQLLALPQDVSRNFRDDISVTVVFFDTEFLRRSMLQVI